MHRDTAPTGTLTAPSVRLAEILTRSDDTSLGALREELEQLYAQITDLQTLVERDALTGAYNRHGLERIEAQVMARRERFGIPVSALFIDIDRLKDLNRDYGHVATDAVLNAATKRLEDLSRPYDTLVRWGGDEFVLLLPEVGLQQAASIADRICGHIGSEPFEIDDRAIPLSVSIGVADMREGEQVIDLVERISGLMYEAKEGGRNQIAVFDGQRAPELPFADRKGG
ncbi:GGDEF domain-containing protein [Amorphus sp. 3PC139-8]|uniref:GGDEF domain-containing protein n=1 Tax=Amorphus sp. 3PC139-8 TaxID=2735676 RepID=UPI00345D3C8F